MTKFFLFIGLLISFNSFAFEWNDKAFKDSLLKLKRGTLEVVTNPEKLIKDVSDRFNSSIAEIKTELKNAERGNDKVIYYYDTISGRAKAYSLAGSPNHFFSLLTDDFKSTSQFISQNGRNTPLIGPYVEQIQKNIDFLKMQNLPNRLYIFKN